MHPGSHPTDKQLLTLYKYIRHSIHVTQLTFHSGLMAIIYLHRYHTQKLSGSHSVGDIGELTQSSLKNGSGVLLTPPPSPTHPDNDKNASLLLVDIGPAPIDRDLQLYTIALITANKHLDDSNYTNKVWCQVSGLSLDQVNKLEREFLRVLRYDVHLTDGHLAAFMGSMTKYMGEVDMVMELRLAAQRMFESLDGTLNIRKRRRSSSVSSSMGASGHQHQPMFTLPLSSSKTLPGSSTPTSPSPSMSCLSDWQVLSPLIPIDNSWLFPATIGEDAPKMGTADSVETELTHSMSVASL